MVLVLTVITLVSSAAVGGVYILTKEPIAQAKLTKTNDAIAQVLPKFDNNPSLEKITLAAGGDTLYAYPARLGDQLLGYAVETVTNEGFGGKIKLMIGILSDGTISSISVLEQNETPGLGDKIEGSKSNFSLQFSGKSPENFKLAVKKDGGDVDAITASTISSRAYLDAVKRAYEIFNEIKEQ